MPDFQATALATATPSSSVGWDRAEIERLRHRRPEREPNRCAVIDLPVCPNASAVALDHAANDGETNSGSLEFIAPMQPLERFEQLCTMGHVETCAVIANREHTPILAIDRDCGLRSLAGELPGVRQQILQRERDQTTISHRGHAVTDADLDNARRIADAFGQLDMPLARHLG